MNETLALAGRGRRFVSTLIDFLLVPGLTLVLVMLTGVMQDPEDYANTTALMAKVLLLAVASYLVLNGYHLARKGQTVGKAVTGIAIVTHTSDAVPPLWKLVAIRALFFPLLYLFILGPLILLAVIDQAFIFRKDRRCLHDLAAGTRVVTLKPR